MASNNALYNVDRIEYLKMIQDIVKRLAGNSFSLKGWCITVTSGVFGINAWTNQNWQFYLLIIIPVIMFWGLDSYYLRQERLFRGLYNRVRKMSDDKLNESMYSMVPPQKGDADYKKDYCFLKVALSPTEAGLYLTLLVIVAIFVIGLFISQNASKEVSNATGAIINFNL